MDYNLYTDEELLRHVSVLPLSSLEQSLADRLESALDLLAILEKDMEQTEEAHDLALCAKEAEIDRLNREAEELSNALSVCESNRDDA